MQLEWYLIYPLTKSVINTLLGKKVLFEVTDKSWTKQSLSEIMHDMRHIILFMIIVLIGILRNPVAILFNILWLIPLFITPFTLYSIQKNRV